MKAYFLNDEDLVFLDQVEGYLAGCLGDKADPHHADLEGIEIQARLREMLRQLRKHATTPLTIPESFMARDELARVQTNKVTSHQGQTPAVIPPRGPRPGEIVGGT